MFRPLRFLPVLDASIYSEENVKLRGLRVFKKFAVL
jgi:hypothetical protein